MSDKEYTDHDPHVLVLDRPNNYKEYDMGNVYIWYPDGKPRAVKTKLILDTDGTAFYSFNNSTSLR